MTLELDLHRVLDEQGVRRTFVCPEGAHRILTLEERLVQLPEERLRGIGTLTLERARALRREA